jgi:hypothetical protein
LQIGLDGEEAAAQGGNGRFRQGAVSQIQTRNISTRFGQRHSHAMPQALTHASDKGYFSG